ncbi:MAG: MarR family transcriptional regulator [Cellulophaga sp.]
MEFEKLIKSTKPLPLPTKVMLNLIYTSNIVQEKVVSGLKDCGLTMQQYNVLRILRGQNRKPANLGTIQERMINKMSNTTRLVDKLLEKKLVTRTVCPSNRRKIEILITDSGFDLLNKLDPITDEKNVEILKNLTAKELETLNNLLDKLK